MPTFLSRTPNRRRRQGQGLAEFVVVLPVLLFLLLLTIDFGRAFYSWVTVHNAARVAANYASLDPYADFTAANGEFQMLTKSESLNAICPITSAGAPLFVDTGNDENTTTRDLGDQVSVTVSCNFSLLTPVVNRVLGNPLPIAASSTFTVRVGPALP
jgi:Flp pilus assembly protein TadG